MLALTLSPLPSLAMLLPCPSTAGAVAATAAADAAAAQETPLQTLCNVRVNVRTALPSLPYSTVTNTLSLLPPT